MWYPEAIARPIPPGSNDPVIVPVGIVWHVRDGEGDSLWPYFSGPSGGIESHWYIRYDGRVEQYRSTTREADANLRGNSWTSGGRRYGLHSVETEGLEHGEWTDAQLEALKALTVWDAREHDWPLQLCPDWNGPGVGYHVMFGAPGPWTGVAKTCPGPDRVRQFERIIVPWLAAGGQEDDMPSPRDWSNADREAVRDIVEAALRYPTIVTAPNDEKWNTVHAVSWLMDIAHGYGDRLARVLANQQAIMQSQGVEVDEDAVARQVAAVVTPAVVDALGDSAGLTAEQVEQAAERAVRDVLGSLADGT